MDVTNSNLSNVTVYCFVADACDGLRLTSDGPEPRVMLFAHSSDIEISNGYGYDSALQNVYCGGDLNFITRQRPNSTISVEELVAAKYTPLSRIR